MHADIYFSVDIEADGPIPGPYSMSSIGVAVTGRFRRTFEAFDPGERTFYRELRPISDDFVPESAAVSGLDRDRLRREGSDPATAMTELTSWIRDNAVDGRPVMIGYPAGYDWMFLYWYLIRFTGASVFGHSRCLDIKTLYATKAKVPVSSVSKGTMPRELRSAHRHTHHALDDAIEQAELFANLMRWEP
jgi:DNA polymerase III epsilon subunit-like protein